MPGRDRLSNRAYVIAIAGVSKTHKACRVTDRPQLPPTTPGLEPWRALKDLIRRFNVRPGRTDVEPWWPSTGVVSMKGTRDTERLYGQCCLDCNSSDFSAEYLY